VKTKKFFNDDTWFYRQERIIKVLRTGSNDCFNAGKKGREQ